MLSLQNGLSAFLKAFWYKPKRGNVFVEILNIPRAQGDFNGDAKMGSCTIKLSHIKRGIARDKVSK